MQYIIHFFFNNNFYLLKHPRLDNFLRYASGAPRFKPNIAKIRKHKTSSMLALDHFDFYYGPMFGKRWPSIRLGILTQNKFVSILNRFSQNYKV